MFSRYTSKQGNLFSKFSKKFSDQVKNSIKRKLQTGLSKSVYLPTTMIGTFLLFTFSKGYSTYSQAELIKHRLEGFTNMADGEMRTYKYGKKDEDLILIVRYNGKFHALTNSCPHFGAPLNTGLI
jgi:hypothetical protein